MSYKTFPPSAGTQNTAFSTYPWNPIPANPAPGKRAYTACKAPKLHDGLFTQRDFLQKGCFSEFYVDPQESNSTDELIRKKLGKKVLHGPIRIHSCAN